MSYLSLPSLNVADSAKGTISLWFRVSDDSVQKARKHGENYPADPLKNEILRGTIPLITFGRKLTGTIWDSVGHLDCVGALGEPAYSFHPTNPTDSPMQPSHIGLSCWGRHQDIMPTLLIVLQTPQKASAQGLFGERIECHFQPLPYTVPWFYETIEEASYVRTSWPEAFTIDPGLHVTTDKWHHVIASWDLSTTVDVVAIQTSGPVDEFHNGDAIRSWCKFYYAFDDENRTGMENMGSAWAYKGENDVTPDGAILADKSYVLVPPATDHNGVPLVTGNVSTSPEWHWQTTPLALNGGPVGLPASADYIDNVYHVELAELQFFVGLVVDTSDTKIRRAFVDASGRPVDPAETEKALGRRPDILLHGTGNWQSGANTGSTGIERATDGTDAVIPAGQFTPVARIDPFKPDPSLEQETA